LKSNYNIIQWCKNSPKPSARKNSWRKDKKRDRLKKSRDKRSDLLLLCFEDINLSGLLKMEDDEYSLSPQQEPQPSQASGKSMKAIY